MGLNGPDQTNMGPLPTYLVPLGPGAQFQLSQSQALSLALSPAVIYCTPWMNSQVYHLIFSDGCWLSTGPVIVTNMPLLWCCGIAPSQWHPLHLGCPLLPAYPPLWNSLVLPLPGNCNYSICSLKLNMSMKGQTLEKEKKTCVASSRGNEAAHLICRQENCCGTSRYSRLCKKSIQTESGQINTVEYSGYTV